MDLTDVSDEVNEVPGDVVDAEFRVYRLPGPGLLEGMYRQCLTRELRRRGRRVEAEVAMSGAYDGEVMEGPGFRPDLLVDDAVVVEVKAVEALAPVHKCQLRTDLKLSGLPVGILLNFHEARLRDGVHRVVLGPAHPLE